MKLHTLQYIEILDDLIRHESALYQMQVLTFFDPASVILRIKLNHHGVLFIFTREELDAYTLDEFQKEFQLKLKDTLKTNKYSDDKAHAVYQYIFRKTNYDSDNRTFWQDKNYGEVSEKLKEELVNLH